MITFFSHFGKAEFNISIRMEIISSKDLFTYSVIFKTF